MGTGISLPAYFFFCAVLAVLYILVLHYTGFQPGMARCALCHWSTFSRQARVIRGCDWWCTVTWSLALRHSKMSPSVWLPFCWGTYWWLGLARTIYMHRIWPYICCGAFGDFPNKSTVYTPYIYGSGQPYGLTHHWRANALACSSEGEWLSLPAYSFSLCTWTTDTRLC
jgi:hypothetical protein